MWEHNPPASRVSPNAITAEQNSEFVDSAISELAVGGFCYRRSTPLPYYGQPDGCSTQAAEYGAATN
eukprot:scaffold378896_cov14-Prasinocladus_malaysianus.AAC.1